MSSLDRPLLPRDQWRTGADANQRLDPSLLLADGLDFVLRYVSDDADAAHRNITRDEVDEYRQAGISIGIVGQNGKAENALEGFDEGRARALVWREILRDVGLGGWPIRFSIDFWPKAWQREPVVEYLKGARSIIGAPRLGSYGPKPIVELLAQAGGVYPWESRLWADPDEPYTWDPRSDARQFENRDLSAPDDPTRRLHYGVPAGLWGYVCIDRAVKLDWGQGPRP